MRMSDDLRRVADEVGDCVYEAQIARLHALVDDASEEDAFKVGMQRVKAELTGIKTLLREAATELDRQREDFEARYIKTERRAAESVAAIVAEGLAESFDPDGWFVYCLWGDDPRVPLYVGQSTNVLSRLGSHLGDGKKRAYIRRVTLTRCKDKATMDKTESRLIAQHQPPWNTIGIVDKEPMGEAISPERLELKTSRDSGQISESAYRFELEVLDAIEGLRYPT